MFNLNVFQLLWWGSELVNSLLETMHSTGADFTNTFRCFSRIELPLSRDVNTPVVGVAEVESHLLQQCATLDELKLAHAPQMDPRFVLCVL